MTSSKISLTHSCEIDMIKQDVKFYTDLLIGLISNQSSSILIFGFTPYISLFITETYKYLQSNYPSSARTLSQNYKEIIRASRTRIKFFDDTNKRIDGIFEHLRWIIDFNEEWHINKHKGVLPPLKRALQDDLGIFFYDNHIIGSTHVGLYNLGYEKKDLPSTSLEISKVFGPLSKSIGEDQGKYLAHISSISEFTPNNLGEIFAFNISDEKLKYKDEKSKRHLNSVFNGEGKIELNFSLLIFLSSINFLQYIYANIVIGKPVALFKLKFITVYHLIFSLEKLRDYFYPTGVLTKHSKLYFEEILKDEDVRFIKRQEELRNILVHYKINDIPETALDLNKNLYGLTEYFLDGKTYLEMEKILDLQIERISKVLEKWINWNISSNKLSSW